MRFLKSLTMLFAAAAILVGSVASAAEISTEIQDFEKALEKRVQEKVQSLFGKDLKLAINIHVVPDPAKKGPQQDSDIGYAPFADSLQDYIDDAIKDGISFSGIEVDIQAPEELNQKVVDGVKSVVEASLKGFSPTVTVTRVVTPSTNPDILTKSAWEKEWKFIVTMIGAILVALMVVAGFGMSLKSSAQAIAEGLKTANSSNIENNTALTLNAEGKGDSKGPAQPAAAPPMSPEKEYERNIQMVRRVLRENPLQLVQSLRDSDTEWFGLRSVLPSLNDEERVMLKKALGARVNRLVQEGEESQVGAIDAVAWLRDFVERMTLRGVGGVSEVEQLLGADAAIVFSLAHPKHILEAAKSVDDKGAWRILTEFYPKELMGALFKDVSEAQWWMIVASGEAAPQEIKAAAERMSAEIERLRSGENDEKSRYLKTHLLTPMVNYLRSAELSKNDSILDDLSRTSPQLAELVKEKVWTPSQLELVPDEHLKKAVRMASYEQKSALLAVLPANHAQRIELMLPEGNVRSIVTDQAKRLKNMLPNTPEYKQAITLARDFLDTLKRQADEGRYNLNTSGQGAAQPTPIREAA